jgi:membrane-bound metal-dependent hydrolase YbcI (DUF457 family)
MKGIAHFITGVAVATFFPEVVRQAAAGSLLPMLGGIAGILPDTLDFRFARYFEKYDLEIDPGPAPDAREIAEQMAGAMRRAYDTGTSQNVMLHTIRLGPDLWRQYTVRLDPGQWSEEGAPPQPGHSEETRFFPKNLVSGQGGEGAPPQRGCGEVAVRIGPVVNTGQVPLPGSEPAGATEARVKIGAPLVHTYDEEIKVDIFSGPSFRFERQGDQLHVHFLDWHRRWSHSLTLAAAMGLGTAGITALIEFVSAGSLTQTPLWAGLVVGLGFAAHVLEDQLGFMGSNLFHPFTRRRTAGLQLLRSGDTVPNFLTVWTAAALILLNLDRFSAQPRLDPWWFLGLAIVLPMAVLGGLYQWQRRRGKPETKESLQQRDIISEMEEVEV